MLSTPTNTKLDDTGTVTFTHNELVKILLDAQNTSVDDDGSILTGPELAEMLGISDKTAQKRVKPLLRDGVIEVAVKQIVNTLGIKTKTRGYRLVTPPIA